MALIKLLQSKHFENITASELINTSKVSRYSFYKYYKDKYNVLEIQQNILFDKIESILENISLAV